MPDKKHFKLPETFDIQGVQIFAPGQWNGDKYTEKDIEELVSAFNETGQTVRPFLKIGHDKEQGLVQKDGMPAVGWIEKLRKVGGKLVADFTKVPKKIFDLIKAGAYRKVSSEIFFNVTVAGKKFPRLLKAVAILGGDTPAVQTLDDIISLYKYKMT
ncbi:MAG TPA: hypothetical protein ENH87_11045, partial [Pricia antarctica]|nr:hypothetical protein [Pricia antarctica]